MKYRQSFVTNSSSSSFIGVFAKLDEKHPKFEENKRKLDDYIITGAEVLANMSRKYFSGYGADWACADLTPDIKSIDENALYVLWEEYGGAGSDDYNFWNEECQEYDYDVCLSDFPYDQELMYQYLINEDNGFLDVEAGYGAGRDG